MLRRANSIFQGLMRGRRKAVPAEGGVLLWTQLGLKCHTQIV